jgi:hypothetical protein
MTTIKRRIAMFAKQKMYILIALPLSSVSFAAIAPAPVPSDLACRSIFFGARAGRAARTALALPFGAQRTRPTGKSLAWEQFAAKLIDTRRFPGQHFLTGRPSPEQEVAAALLEPTPSGRPELSVLWEGFDEPSVWLSRDELGLPLLLLRRPDIKSGASPYQLYPAMYDGRYSEVADLLEEILAFVRREYPDFTGVPLDPQTGENTIALAVASGASEIWPLRAVARMWMGQQRPWWRDDRDMLPEPTYRRRRPTSSSSAPGESRENRPVSAGGAQ